MTKISVVLAIYNEERNIAACLDSVNDLAAEIVIVDGGSVDRSVEIAKRYQAKIIYSDNPPIFHINKQKALEKASFDWILQLDADERVTKKLAQEVIKVVAMTKEELDHYQGTLSHRNLFLRHQELVEARDGRVGEVSGPYNAFYIPRSSYFLGRYLKYGGVYPDGVIRLVTKGKAYFPCKSVHEQIAVTGRVGWLDNDLIHLADYSFQRYLERNSRYINLIRDELIKSRTDKSVIKFIDYCLIKPLWWFFITQIRHKGILDGFPGIVFSFFSALRFPRAYLRYLRSCW